MLKILLIADIHGEIDKLSTFLDNFNRKDMDLVVCPGDFTDMFNIPDGYSQMDVAEVVLQKILSLGKPTLCVPGNHDPHEILELFEDYSVNIHAKSREFKGFKFIGFGGATTPFNTRFEPTEEEIKKNLSGMFSPAKGKNILVTHAPPYGTKLDTTENGKHVGSKAIRSIIEREKPVLAVSAHIHESGGIDKLGGTKAFYPGPVFEGYYGIVSLGKEVKCEIKKF